MVIRRMLMSRKWIFRECASVHARRIYIRFRLVDAVYFMEWWRSARYTRGGSIRFQVQIWYLWILALLEGGVVVRAEFSYNPSNQTTTNKAVFNCGPEGVLLIHFLVPAAGKQGGQIWWSRRANTFCGHDTKTCVVASTQSELWTHSIIFTVLL